ncbi:right-handed parallel beta-helix repeat-containing protein [Nitrosomonas sp.]|uniref:right-handed parallel beta-helix repeat-containing protein n=1 Tax=Nitrosomonas sp. TaxID=42353 RepID=UPI0028437AAB|nr:right-handed parallel beta-helix repeat-containing protein [Nitrosomonas sp.]MDR4515615.1 right-handed parallel beta-helix repeat-containing protein [Nitrosomonas sp.]
MFSKFGCRKFLTFLALILTSGSAFSLSTLDLSLPYSCPTEDTEGTAYLSHYVSASSDNKCSASVIQNLIFRLGRGGTLIVDRICRLDQGLVLPSRFNLKGLGMEVGGVLAFTYDGAGLSGCPDSPHGYITISDLVLSGPNPSGKRVVAPKAIGINLFNQHIVYINNVRIQDFVTGIIGKQSYSVYISGSNISNNRGDNIRIGYDANSWRIRDSIISQADGWGINVYGPGDERPLGTINGSNDLLLDGLRMESNKSGAVRFNSYGSRIENSRLEANGVDKYGRAILVDTHAEQTRILTNYFSGNCIQDDGLETRRSFNIPSLFDREEC